MIEEETKKTKTNQTLCITLPIAMSDWLIKDCKAKDMSRAARVRILLKAYINENE